MLKREWLPLVAGLVTIAGCTMSPLYQLEQPGLERNLPSGVALTDYVETDWAGYRVTVAEKLARLGAYSEGQGVIRDGAGKEIRFFKHPDHGANPAPEVVQREHAELRELKKRFDVIEIVRAPEALPRAADPTRRDPEAPPLVSVPARQ